MDIEFGVGQEVWIVVDGKFRRRFVREIKIDKDSIMFNVDNYWTSGDDMGCSIHDLCKKMSDEAKRHYDKE